MNRLLLMAVFLLFFSFPVTTLAKPSTCKPLTDFDIDIHDVCEKPADLISWGKRLIKYFDRDYFDKSYAIVIGISGYDNYWRPITSPLEDAKKVRDRLIKMGFDHVVTLTNKEATKKNIRKYMEEIFPGKVKANDKFLFYFSGHGTQRKLPGGKIRGYLPMSSSGEKIYADMISMTELDEWDQNLGDTKHVLFVLDSCFSGLAGFQTAGEPKILYIDELSKKGHHLITAGTAGQESFGNLKQWGGSLFTHAFLKGISGNADSESGEFKKDGLVSLTELHEYIRKKIKSEVIRNDIPNQTPMITYLQESHGEFYFISDEADNQITKEREVIAKAQPSIDVETKGNVKTSKGMVQIPGGEFSINQTKIAMFKDAQKELFLVGKEIKDLPQDRKKAISFVISKMKQDYVRALQVYVKVKPALQKSSRESLDSFIKTVESVKKKALNFTHNNPGIKNNDLLLELLGKWKKFIEELKIHVGENYIYFLDGNLK